VPVPKLSGASHRVWGVTRHPRKGAEELRRLPNSNYRPTNKMSSLWQGLLTAPPSRHNYARCGTVS
jgi:hypothetical protein